MVVRICHLQAHTCDWNGKRVIGMSLETIVSTKLRGCQNWQLYTSQGMQLKCRVWKYQMKLSNPEYKVRNLDPRRQYKCAGVKIEREGEVLETMLWLSLRWPEWTHRPRLHDQDRKSNFGSYERVWGDYINSGKLLLEFREKLEAKNGEHLNSSS